MRTVQGEKGTYEILLGKDICDVTLTPKTKAHLSRLMEIDAQVYGGEDKGDDCVYVGDIGGYIDRFGYESEDDGAFVDLDKGCVDNIVAVAKEGRIIGYINYLTMDDELYDEIIHPDIEAYLEDPSRRDDGITGDQLRKWSKDQPNNLFILSIAIDKEYQDGETIKVLTNAFLQELRDKEAQGYEVTSISDDTVSDHGEDIAKMFRCEIVNDNGKQLILPAPESDESGHPVTVRICEGENMQKLLQEGFDFNRERSVHVEKPAVEAAVAEPVAAETAESKHDFLMRIYASDQAYVEEMAGRRPSDIGFEMD